MQTNTLPDSPKKSYINKKVVIVVLVVSILLLLTIVISLLISKKNNFVQQILSDYGLVKKNSTSQSSNSSSSNPTLLTPAEPTISTDTIKPGSSISTVQLIEKEIPSVLSISVKTTKSSVFNDVQIAGTGYIIDKNGLVVTNKHVISPLCTGDTEVKISGVTNDQKSYDLQLISIDPVEDLAILKISNPDKVFEPVKFADSTKVKLGSDVIAIGNALGELQNTVTKGIVSGLNRNLNQTIKDPCTGVDIFPESLIQTDAAINQGNSGGPLFDSEGLIIGMNTYGSGGENIGLAIPSNRILAAVNSYLKNGKIIRPKLGVSTQSISPIIKTANDWIPTEYGELIYSQNGSSIAPGSAAAKAGLSEGDIILEINSIKLIKTSVNSSPLKTLLLNFDANTEISLTVLKAKESAGKYTYGNPVTITALLGGQSFDLNKSTK